MNRIKDSLSSENISSFTVEWLIEDRF
jgi:hypothetical protein